MESENPPFAMTLDCHCMGSVHGALAQSRGRVGRVINVFERTINVRTAQDELMVITLDTTRSPVNLNVRTGHEYRVGFSGLAMEDQDVVVNVNLAGARPHTTLQVGEVALSIDEPDVFQNSLHEPVAGFLHTFAAELDRIFDALVAGAVKRRGCLLNPDMTTEGLLATFLGRLETAGTANGTAVLAEALAGLCGRGPGFTPAGDDFIAGYLAAFNWLSRALKLGSPMIPGGEFSQLTTWTSFKLIEYAARGFLDNQAQLMVNSAAKGDVADYIRCVELVGRRGHTSGIDFATGVTIGLCSVADKVFCTGTMNHVSGVLGRARPAQLS